MHRRACALLLPAAVLGLALGASRAGAAIVWQADPSKGTSSFGQLNLEGGATITVVDDATYGKVYRCYHPPASGRCETSHLPNDLHAKEGDLWYISWRFKVDMPKNQTDNAVFQWKSYPAAKQNWPIVFKHMSGSFYLLYHNPQYVSEYPWKGPTVVNEWLTIVLAIKVSRDPNVGYIEFWYNGAPQALSNGSQRYPARTLDDGYDDPKWGIYGASGATMTNYVFPPKIATTYEEAALVGSSFILTPEKALGRRTRAWDPQGWVDGAGRSLGPQGPGPWARSANTIFFIRTEP